MDSVELLAREDEFKKLNKQLERKTESLIKEIEHVMQKQDIFSEFSHNLSLTPTHSTKKHLCTSPTSNNQDQPLKKPVKSTRAKTAPQKDSAVSPVEEDCGIQNKANGSTSRRDSCNCCLVSRKDNRNDDLEFLHAFVSVSIQEKVLPASFQKEAFSIQSVCKFLSSKAKLLQEQIDMLETTLNKKASQCDSHLTRHAELEGERLALLNKCNSLQAAAADAKAKCTVAEQKLAEKDRLYRERRSECGKLGWELKRAKAELTAALSREAQQTDTVHALRQKLAASKLEHSDFQLSTRALSAANQSTIDNLESRIKVLCSAIEKQVALIDNLRKQNAILRSDYALQALEKEYSDFLTQEL